MPKLPIWNSLGTQARVTLCSDGETEPSVTRLGNPEKSKCRYVALAPHEFLSCLLFSFERYLFDLISFRYSSFYSSFLIPGTLNFSLGIIMDGTNIILLDNRLTVPLLDGDD